MMMATQKNLPEERSFFSLADCEEGKVSFSSVSSCDLFRYPSIESDDDTVSEKEEINDAGHLFRWHYTDETDANSSEKRKTSSFRQRRLAAQVSKRNQESKELNNCETNKNITSFKEDTITNGIKQVSYDKKGCEPKHYRGIRKWFKLHTGHFMQKKANSREKINDHLSDENKTNKINKKSDENINGHLHTFATTTVDSDEDLTPNSALAQDKNSVRSDRILSTEEAKSRLLDSADMCYKNKEYDQALQFYEDGHRLHPSSKEFQSGISKCRRKINKKDYSKKVKGKAEEDQLNFTYTNPICPAVFWAENTVDNTSYQLSTEQQSNLEEIEHQIASGEYLTAVQHCEKILKQHDNYNVEDIANEIGTDGSSNSENEVRFLARLMSLTAKCYEELGFQRKAISYYLKCLNFAIHIDDGILRHDVLVQAALLYTKMDQHQKAVFIWKQLLEFENKASKDYSWLHYQISICYYALGEYELAMKFVTQALKLADKVKNTRVRLDATVLQAQLILVNGCISKSNAAFGQALTIAEDLGDDQMCISIREALEEMDEILAESEKK